MNRPEWPDAGGWRAQFPKLPKARNSILVGLAIIVAAVFLPGPGIVIGVALGVLFDIAVRADWPDEEPDSYWFSKWVRGAHYAHGGTRPGYTGYGAFPLDECTEPECEEGRVWLDRAYDKDRDAWARGKGKVHR